MVVESANTTLRDNEIRTVSINKTCTNQVMDWGNTKRLWAQKIKCEPTHIFFIKPDLCDMQDMRDVEVCIAEGIS